MTEDTPSEGDRNSSKLCLGFFGRQLPLLCTCQRGDDPQDADATEPPVITIDSSFLDPPPDTTKSEVVRQGSWGSCGVLDREDSGAGDMPHKRVSGPLGADTRKITLELPPDREERRQNSLYSNQFGSQFLSTASSWYSSDLDPFNLVKVDDEFDFYDPSTKEMKVIKLADVHDNVLHEREAKTNSTPPGQSSRSPWKSLDSKDSDSEGYEGSQSDSSLGSDSESENMGEKKRISTVSRVDRRGSFFDADAVTNWGTIVAKMMRRKLTGISATATRAMHKRRHTLRSAEVQSRHYILPTVRDRAQFVVERARLLEKKLGTERDQVDSGWMVGSTTLITLLFGDDYIDTLMLLANTVRKVVSAQPILVDAGTPCRVFGDTHGQFRDILVLFKAFGFPGDNKNESFVFNGDFVDRGSHSLEVIGMLFAMKILMPEVVWLVRGNHEDRAMNERYGFLNDCFSILGRDVGPKTYELIQRAFDELPLACVISEKIFVVHGGLGNGKFTLNDIRAVERPLRDKSLASNEMVWNMLWSDPIEDDQEANEQGVFGVHPSPRSSSGIFKFGWNVTKTFCAANGLGLVIRSHQSKEGSLGFSLMHDKMLIRVFSARDYEGHGNDGAVILISDLVKSEKWPNARKGHLLVRPQVVRSVTKMHGGGKKRKKSKKRTVKNTSPHVSPR